VGPEYEEEHVTTELFPRAGEPLINYAPQPGETLPEGCLDDAGNSFHPFDSEESFNFADLMISKGIASNVVDSLLKGNYGVKDYVKDELRSVHQVKKKIDQMTDGLGHESWRRSTLHMGWNEAHPEPIEYWNRDIILCMRWLMRQPAYKDHLAYTPERRFVAGRRTYGEMHTAEWWWEKQVLLPLMNDSRMY
jgi:hypothetical protein